MQPTRYSLPLTLLILIIATSVFAQSDSLNQLLDRGGRQLYVKKYKEAIGTLEQALKLDSNNFEALQNLGMAHSALGNQGQARNYFEKAHAIKPNDAGINNNLGGALSAAGDADQAIKYFETAVNLDSSSAMYHSNLGIEYLKIGRTIAGMP
ncbi:MAG TPA: tetratricopeptide repeat protein, partial [candidate division Zixibacteria bacterium]|nr:tetratricopeptide repeat protein [candidate division Zixibacteria bacterium]